MRSLNSLVRSILCRMVYRTGALKLAPKYVEMAKKESLHMYSGMTLSQEMGSQPALAET